MPREVAETRECFLEQRRRAAGEQSYSGTCVASEPGMLEQSCIEVGMPMNTDA